MESWQWIVESARGWTRRDSLLARRTRDRIHHAAQAELIPGAHGPTVSEINLQYLLAVNLAPGLVFQGGDELARLHVEDFAGREVRELAVEAERDPAGLLAQGQARHLFGREFPFERARVEDVHALVVAVHDPDFFLVRREADAMTRTAVPLDRAFLHALNFDAVEHLARADVADFKAEQVVDVDEDERLRAVDGEGADGRAERADGLDDGVRRGVHDAHHYARLTSA
jgi:hypothetical protein